MEEKLLSCWWLAQSGNSNWRAHWWLHCCIYSLAHELNVAVTRIYLFNMNYGFIIRIRFVLIQSRSTSIAVAFYALATATGDSPSNELNTDLKLAWADLNCQRKLGNCLLSEWWQQQLVRIWLLWNVVCDKEAQPPVWKSSMRWWAAGNRLSQNTYNNSVNFMKTTKARLVAE